MNPSRIVFASLAAFSLLAAACSDDADSPASSTSSSATAMASASSGAGGASVSSGAGGASVSSGAGGASVSSGAGGASASSSGGGGMLDKMVVGDWMPKESQQGMNNPPMPVPPGSPFYVLRADGTLGLKCGGSEGTWTFDANAPAPAIGVLHVTLPGSNMVDWYVLTLTATKLQFVEGGDLFTFERAACP